MARSAPSHWLTGFDGPLPARSKPPDQAEVAVVGGGVVGVAAAYWLARLGCPVVLFEASRLGWKASGRNAGLMLSGSSPLESSDDLRAVLGEEHISCEYERTGHLALASSPSVLDRMRLEVASRPASAPPLYVLDRAECRVLLNLRLHPRYLGGRWLASGAAMHPARFVYGLAGAAVRRGARIYGGTPVTAIRHLGGDCLDLMTPGGSVRTRRVLIACNYRATRFLPSLKRVLRPYRGQVLSTAPLPRLFRHAMAVDWGSVYWRQAPDGAIVLGGCRSVNAGPESTGREGLNPSIQMALSSFLSKAFPGFPRVEVRRQWSGIMDETTDGKPIVGLWPKSRNIWIAGGFGGHGLPPALGFGSRLATAMLSGQCPEELARFAPARFKELTE